MAHVGKYFVGPDVVEGPPRRLAVTEFAAQPSRAALVEPKAFARKTKPEIKPASEQYLMVRPQALQLVDDVKRAAAAGTSTTRLLTGPRGCGKSATLLHLVRWARASNWLTLYIPRASDWVTAKSALAAGTGTSVAFVPSPLTKDAFAQPLGALAVLNNLAAAHSQQLLQLPQRRKYDHGLYEGGAGSTSSLGHILYRGINSLPHACDALFDLRMELSLVEEVPVLVAVDEVDALYWPTALWMAGKPLRTSQLLLCRAFRFLGDVTGETADRDFIRARKQAAVVRPEHVPKRGALVGALTRGLQSPPHPTLAAPKRLDDAVLRGCVKDAVGAYSSRETEAAWAWYSSSSSENKAQSLVDAPGVVRGLTDGVAEQVFKHAQGSMVDVVLASELRRRHRGGAATGGASAGT